MRNEKLWRVLSIVALALLVLAETMAAAIVLQLDMLPGKYIALLIGLMLVAVAGIALLFFLKGKDGVSLTRRIIAFVLVLVVVVICGFASYYASIAYKTLHAVTDKQDLTYEANGKQMYVFVRADDPAEKLQDAKDYTYGMIHGHDEERTQKFVQWIADQTGTTPEPAGYPQAVKLAEALLNKNVDAIILNGVSVAALLEEKGYEDFLDKAKVLEKVSFATLEGKPETDDTPVMEVEPVADVTNTPFIVYVSGSDAYGTSLLKNGRNDVNILMVVNPSTKQILLLNTPRDYFVPNPYYNGKLDKLTHCGWGGVENSIATLENLYTIDINYYGRINFAGFEKLIDIIGGVTVYSDQSFTTTIGSHYIQKGENYLNGSQALGFARERYRVNGGDNTRGKNQMKVITAVIEKVTSGTTLISNYAAIMSSLEGMFATNMQSTEISKLVKMQLNDMAKWDIKSFAVTGTGASMITASIPGAEAYVTIPDQKTVDHALSLINKVMEGEKLTSDDLVVPK